MTLEELGAALRSEREKRALSVDDISEILKIGARLLRALEEGDVASLPHPTYTRGFLRSYASFLGLAAEEVNSAVIPLRHDDTITVQSNVYIPEASRKQRKKSLAPLIILLLIIACGIAFAWRPLYTALRTAPQHLAEPAPPVPAQGQTPQPSAQAAVQTPPQENSPPLPASPQRVQSSPIPKPDAETPAAPPATQNTVAAPAATQSKPAAHNVIVTATEECWIYSRADGTDTRQFSLSKGDTFALTFQKKLELKLGNAGGVRVRYDGQDMPSPGQTGQVRTLNFPPAGQD